MFLSLKLRGECVRASKHIVQQVIYSEFHNNSVTVIDMFEYVKQKLTLSLKLRGHQADHLADIVMEPGKPRVQLVDNNEFHNDKVTINSIQVFGMF